jgi:hypothetical protein
MNKSNDRGYRFWAEKPEEYSSDHVRSPDGYRFWKVGGQWVDNLDPDRVEVILTLAEMEIEIAKWKQDERAEGTPWRKALESVEAYAEQGEWGEAAKTLRAAAGLADFLHWKGKESG